MHVYEKFGATLLELVHLIDEVNADFKFSADKKFIFTKSVQYEMLVT